MTKMKRAIAVLLCAVLMLTAAPLGGLEKINLSSPFATKAQADSPTSGVCGPDLTWHFDVATLTLSINGTGPMNWYESIYGVTSAPWKKYNDVIKSLVIGNGVSGVGPFAFFGCSGLTSIDISDGVKTIGKSAFGNCVEIASIEIPNSVTAIKEGAFSGCSKLESVILPDGLTIIEYQVFANCTSLTDVMLPNTITTIDINAFHACKELRTINLPNNITEIKTGAFSNCTKLDSIAIPNGIMSISNNTFSGCKGLSSISIPDSVIDIGAEAFRDCTGLTSIKIGKSVINIGDFAFYGCTCLSSIEVEDKNPVFHSEGNCLIKTASKTLFLGCPKSTIPSDGSITSIGKYAFSGCSGLTSIAIPDSVEIIDDHSFERCSGLSSITIPRNVVSIGSSSFEDCAQLNIASIPNSMKSIYKYAFEGCSALEDVFYQGTRAQWEHISIADGNDHLRYSHIHYLGEIYTATFLVDGEVYKIEEFTATQESILEPDIPEKPGYTGAWSPYILDEQDITIEAIYTPIEYTATYISDGETIEVIPFTVESLDYTPPAVPEKQGHSGAWKPYSFNYADLTIHAIYTPNTYTATVIADGETIAEIPFTYGQKSIQLPGVPKKEGNTGAWPAYSLGAEDITIEAVYTPIEYTVTYYADDQVIGSGAIPYGNSIWRPRTPQKEGYTFTGWTPKVPETMPANDLTFYAVFEPNAYTVTWIVDGAAFKTESILFGEPITALTPEKEGYTFSGWDAEIPAAMPAKDLTFSGSFSLNQYTLCLISDGAELVNTKIAHGAPFQLLTAPTKTGYTLLGWSTDPAATTAAYAVGGSYTFTTDTTLYAVWQKNAGPEKPPVTIQGFVPTKNVDYKTSVTFKADLSNAPAGATAHWFIDGKDVHTGETYTLKQATKDYTVQVKLYAADGTELYASEVETVKVKTDFFSRLIAFFRQLFGALPKITQAINDTL